MFSPDDGIERQTHTKIYNECGIIVFVRRIFLRMSADVLISILQSDSY